MPYVNFFLFWKSSDFIFQKVAQNIDLITNIYCKNLICQLDKVTMAFEMIFDCLYYILST